MDPEIVCVRLSYWRFSETKLRFDLLQLFKSLILASLNVKCLDATLISSLFFAQTQTCNNLSGSPHERSKHYAYVRQSYSVYRSRNQQRQGHHKTRRSFRKEEMEGILAKIK